MAEVVCGYLKAQAGMDAMVINAQGGDLMSGSALSAELAARSPGLAALSGLVALRRDAQQKEGKGVKGEAVKGEKGEKDGKGEKYGKGEKDGKGEKGGKEQEEEERASGGREPRKIRRVKRRALQKKELLASVANAKLTEQRKLYAQAEQRKSFAQAEQQKFYEQEKLCQHAKAGAQLLEAKWLIMETVTSVDKLKERNKIYEPLASDFALFYQKYENFVAWLTISELGACGPDADKIYKLKKVHEIDAATQKLLDNYRLDLEHFQLQMIEKASKLFVTDALAKLNDTRHMPLTRKATVLRKKIDLRNEIKAHENAQCLIREMLLGLLTKKTTNNIRYFSTIIMRHYVTSLGTRKPIALLQNKDDVLLVPLFIELCVYLFHEMAYDFSSPSMPDDIDVDCFHVSFLLVFHRFKSFLNQDLSRFKAK
jgi:hypothetical protein